jgi:5-deoxy-D-glucuronate isomerase
MLELSMVDLGEVATALQDQTVYEYRWLIDPQSGQISVWTEDGGIDGRMLVDLEDVGLLPIEPLPS